MGDKCQVSGWKNANSKLIHWNVTIVDDSLCGDAFEKYNATENLGCAQGEEVNKYRFLRNNKGADLNHYFILGYNLQYFEDFKLYFIEYLITVSMWMVFHFIIFQFTF